MKYLAIIKVVGIELTFQNKSNRYFENTGKKSSTQFNPNPA